MPRARYFEVATDTSGRPIASVTVNVYQPGTTTPIAETIYAADSGAATLSNPLTANAQGEILFYLAAPARVDLQWVKAGYTTESYPVDVLSADLMATDVEVAASISGLSGTYVAVTPTPGDATFPAPYLRGDTADSFTARPNGSSATRSPLEWIHDDTTAYLMHLTGGTNMAGSAALIGMGVDNGGTGLFANNKKTGVGVKITQNNTITSATAYGLLVNASSTLAPGAWFGQGIAGAAPALEVGANVAPSAGKKLMRWFTTVSAAGDTELGYVDAQSQHFVWNAVIQAGQAVRARSGTQTPKVSLINDAATSGQRWFDIATSFGNFVISQKGDTGTGGSDILIIAALTGNVTLKAGATLAADTTTGLKIGAAPSKLGFFNATPIVKPTGVAVDAAGIHAALVSLGLIAA